MDDLASVVPVTCPRYTLATAKRAAKRIGLRFAPKVTPQKLLEGMRVEREHRDVTHCRPTTTAKIAATHLRERSDYYKRLKRCVERRRS